MVHQTHFAFDCGATNWRLFRANYEVEGNRITLVSDPKPSPLTSFSDRKLPAAILLSPDGESVESFGEVAQQRLNDEALRERVREYFKPCIGAHLLDHPLPHQQRYTHAEALSYNRMLLTALIEQLHREKWRGGALDERVFFAFAHPVHWRTDHEGELLEAFADSVRSCLPEDTHSRIRFVAEPEGAILSLQRHGLLSNPEEGLTLITDVGGSTTDLIAGILDADTGGVNYLGCYGEPFGGGLYDAELAKHFADELGVPASVLADDPSAMLSLRVFARRLKESLSRQMLLKDSVEVVAQRTLTLITRAGQVYRRVIKLSNARFAEITRKLNHSFEDLIAQGMQTFGLDDREIAQVALVGGGAQLFSIVGHLRDRFGDAKVVLADNPEEAVANGISLEYGASLSRARPSMIYKQPGPVNPSMPSQTEQEAPGSVWYLVSKKIVFPVSGRKPLTIGRSPANPIHLTSEKVSRTHAKLLSGEDGLIVIDQGSTNGTFINEQRLAHMESAVLQVNDRIRFGDQSFTLLSQV